MRRQPSVVFKQLKMEGFVVTRWAERWPAAFLEIIPWIKSGKLKAAEHVTEGFDKLYDAFIGMLAGENFGKAVVMVHNLIRGQLQRSRTETFIDMVKQKKYVVKKYFKGIPKRDDFEIVETELPPIKNGEILVKTEWISVDPYQRDYNRRSAVPYDQFGFQVASVVESKDPRYSEGSRIVSHRGWCDYSIINANDCSAAGETVYKLPDLQGLPTSLGVGAIGMHGATAYFGLLELCQPKAGETVVVTGAAGAVGSLVGQIAKIKGCKVIGFAGSDDKVEWLEKELGFDKALNYKTVDVVEALKEAAPNGVDCYFDNVGGYISSQIISRMNMYGRVSVCRSISSYNADPSAQPSATIRQPSIVFKQLKIEGFVVSRWATRWHEAFADLIKWTKSGQLKAQMHVTEGFDKVYDAFVGMLAGENYGKAVVKV